MRSVLSEIDSIDSLRRFGEVKSVVGPLLQVTGLQEYLSVGSLCELHPKDCSSFYAEVVGFQDEVSLLMPFASHEGVRPKTRVDFHTNDMKLAPHPSWLGRVLNGYGKAIDGKGPLLQGHEQYSTRSSPPPAHQRSLVKDRLDLGLKAMNTFLTCCKGQRMGIFAGSGVGKSVLLAQIAKFTEADVIVIGLIGERGREVREFIEDHLGEEGMKRAVVVVATSDEPAPMRRQAAYVTLTVAEAFRNEGLSVLCLMDSVTRFAMALREIGLAAGEPPASKGYTPGVFAELPRLLERSGPGLQNQNQGSITGLFTVLVEGDDHNEPVSDAVRGIVDGHIVLDRQIAERGRFPAINILRSISRMVPKCHTEIEQKIVIKARALLSAYDDMADMIRLGAYKKGSDPVTDEAIKYHEALHTFLSQKPDEQVTLKDSFLALAKILDGAQDS